MNQVLFNVSPRIYKENYLGDTVSYKVVMTPEEKYILKMYCNGILVFRHAPKPCRNRVMSTMFRLLTQNCPVAICNEVGSKTHIIDSSGNDYIYNAEEATFTPVSSCYVLK